jgi:phosphoribosylaminoimidazolecarboxamide formyltransferase/IMP cyclohydrolase
VAAEPHESRPIRRALISVYDKTGIVDFARALHGEFGIEIISTGGTAKTLREAGIPVTLIEDITGFSEMLDGRVKTLHPKIHAAILADRDNPEHMRQLAAAGVEPIDMVVVNLYPFERTVADPNCTFEQAIEMIDIGGVALLRAAAKNHRHVLVISDAATYNLALCVLRQPEPSQFRRQLLAQRALLATCAYDGRISEWLGSRAPEGLPRVRVLRLWEQLVARYGENPHQRGAVYDRWPNERPNRMFRDDNAAAPTASFNNYLDADAALGLCAELARRGSVNCCFIKHTNPCGVGTTEDPLDAYRRAYLGDPNAAMGGILACSFPVDAAFAVAVMETYDRFGKPLKEAGATHAPGGFFVEVWLAPHFDDAAVEIIRGKRSGGPQKKWGENVRLLAVGDVAAPPDPDELQYRSIAGGMLVQTPDLVGLNEDQWKVVTQRAPTEAETADLRLAWLIAKHTKSNAISIVKDGMLLGNGAGQMSRVMSCRIATWLAKENGHAEQLPGSVAASDAFFPFADGPQLLIDAGVTALIQPGGSKRDADTIKLCDERGIAMIFTGTRHFRH